MVNMVSQDIKMMNYAHTVQESYLSQTTDVTAGKDVFSLKELLKKLCAPISAAVLLMTIIYGVSGYITQKSYEMQQIRSEIILLEKQNAADHLEVARLESPARIQKIAETELGMTVPKQAIYGSSDMYVNTERIHE